MWDRSIPLSFHIFKPVLNSQPVLLKVYRDVTKISSCHVNTTSRWGIKLLEISFGYIFIFFPMKVARGHVHNNQVKSLALNDSPDYVVS